MCQFASFKHNPHLQELVVADLFSHGRTEELTGKTEKQGWYDGHYLPDDTIQCRIPGRTDKVMEAWVKKSFPTFSDFLLWAFKNGADVNAKDPDGRTALYWASRNGHTDCVKLLIEAKADVNAKDSDGRTALYWASCKGHTDCVKLLKEAGAV